MGSTIFTDGPFNVQLCADACSMKSAYNLAHPPTDGSPVQTCQFFNTYILYVNTITNLQGQYCAMYSESWPASYATNKGQYRRDDHFMISYSFAYSNIDDPGAACKECAVNQASKDIDDSTLQPFCSTLLGYSTPLRTVTDLTTTTPISTTTTTTTVTSVTTPEVVLKKRQDESLTPAIATSGTWIVKTLVALTLAARDVSPTPDVLTKYPPSILTSACSLVATPVSETSTINALATVTAPTVVVTSTIVTTTTRTTSTSAAPMIPTTIPCGQTVTAEGSKFTIVCNVQTVVPDRKINNQVAKVAYRFTASDFASCLSDLAQYRQAGGNLLYGADYTPANSVCTEFTYPYADHYVTEVAPGVVHMYLSDLLTG